MQILISILAKSALHVVILQAWMLYEDDKHLDLVDQKLDPNEFDREYVKKIIYIALMCTQLPASLRPAMSEVVVLLTSELLYEKRPLSMNANLGIIY